MSKKTKILIAILSIVAVVALIVAAPSITRAVNTWRFGIQVAHDETDYATLRTVEDTARAMIASFNSDSLTWEQFRDSEVQEERNWANAARMRANRTAMTYNEFILRNSFVWRFGVPNDIFMELPTIQ